MLTDAEIVALYRGMEADRVERKRDYKSAADKIKQAICAFANDFPDRRVPGVVFVGQNDDGSCAGIDVNDELLLNLGGLRTEILPFPVMSVARKQIDGCTVAIIEVAPSQQPPVRVDGRTWIGVGPRRATATPEEERLLSEKQVWRNLPFDSRPVLDASWRISTSCGSRPNTRPPRPRRKFNARTAGRRRRSCARFGSSRAKANRPPPRSSCLVRILAPIFPAPTFSSCELMARGSTTPYSIRRNSAEPFRTRFDNAKS